MSSLRPVTRRMRRCVRPQSQRSCASARDVARAVAQHRQRFLGQRRDHQFAGLAVGHRRAGLGVDELEQEVVLPAVQPVAAFALAGHARAHDLGQAVDVVGAQAEARLDLVAHRRAPGLGAEHADAQPAAPQVDAHLLGHFGDRQRIGRRRAQHARTEVHHQRHLALGAAAGDRHHRAAQALGAAVRAQAAGEQAVAVGVVHQVAAPHAGAGHRTRHQVGPAVQVAGRIADDGGLAGRARRGMHARERLDRPREEAEGVVVAQVGLDHEGQAPQVVEAGHRIRMQARGVAAAHAARARSSRRCAAPRAGARAAAPRGRRATSSPAPGAGRPAEVKWLLSAMAPMVVLPLLRLDAPRRRAPAGGAAQSPGCRRHA